MIRRTVAALGMALLLMSLPLGAQSKKKNPDDEKFRVVKGTVFDASDVEVNGATVQLKNGRTKQIRSFVTQDKGGYYFNQLDVNVDYELRAITDTSEAKWKTLSSFDSRRDPVVNLKLEPKP